MDKMRISEKITRKLLPITPFLFFQFMIKGITRKKKLLNPCTQRFTVFFIVRQRSFISCLILIKIAKIGWEMTYATNLCNLIEDSKKFTIFRTKTVKMPPPLSCFVDMIKVEMIACRAKWYGCAAIVISLALKAKACGSTVS